MKPKYLSKTPPIEEKHFSESCPKMSVVSFCMIIQWGTNNQSTVGGFLEICGIACENNLNYQNLALKSTEISLNVKLKQFKMEVVKHLIMQLPILVSCL